MKSGQCRAFPVPLGKDSFCNEISRILQGCSAKCITHGFKEFLGRKHCFEGVTEPERSSFGIDFINDDRGSTKIDHGLRVVSLVIITVMWIGKKDSRNHVCTRFGDGGGAGTTYTRICCAPGLPHAMQERSDLCMYTGFLPRRLDCIDRGLFPAEVEYLPSSEGFGTLQGCQGQGVVQCTRSL